MNNFRKRFECLALVTMTCTFLLACQTEKSTTIIREKEVPTQNPGVEIEIKGSDKGITVETDSK